MRYVETTARRWYQFRLRTLLVVGLGLSLLFSGLAARLEEERKAWEAIRSIQRFGGVVSSYGGRTSVSPTPPTIWTVLDGQRSSYVSQVEYSGVAVTENQFLQLKALGYLGVLVLDNCVIDDTDLEHVAQLDISELYIVSDHITDKGLAHLQTLKGADLILIGGECITERGLNHLRQARPDCYIDRIQVVPPDVTSINTVSPQPVPPQG